MAAGKSSYEGDRALFLKKHFDLLGEKLDREEIEEMEELMAAFSEDMKEEKECLERQLIRQKEAMGAELEKTRLFEMETPDFPQQKLLQCLRDNNAAIQKDVDAQEERVKNLYIERDDLIMDVEVAKVEDYFTQIKCMLIEEERLRLELDSVSTYCDEKTADLLQLEVELQAQRSKNRELEATMQEAATIVRRTMTEEMEPDTEEAEMKRLIDILKSTNMKKIRPIKYYSKEEDKKQNKKEGPPKPRWR